MLGKSDLDVICYTCRAKLRSIQEYFEFVLENQFKFKVDNNAKNNNNHDNVKLSMIKESHQPVSVKNSALSSLLSKGILDYGSGFSIKQEPVEEDDMVELMNHPAPLTPPTSIDESHDEEEEVLDTSELIPSPRDNRQTSGYQSRLSPEKLQLRQKQNDLIKQFLNLQCQLCPQSLPFRDFSKLANHMKKTHGVPLEVPCCNKLFRLKHLYLQHLIKNHSGTTDNRYPCPDCNQSYSTSCKLEVHRYIDHFYCHLCKEKISNVKTRPSLRSHLQQHALSKDPKQVEPFKCHYCAKEFRDREKVKAHLRLVHMTKVGTICHQCGIEFKTRSAFILHHQRQHENGKKKSEA